MMASVGGSAVAGGASALATGSVSLVGIRALSGVALAEQSVNATYLNEVFALSEDKKVKKNQGLIYAFVQTGWPVGALMAAGFVGLVTAWFGPDNWRLAFLISMIPDAVGFAFIYSFVQTGWPVGALMAACFVGLVTAWFGPDNWRIAFLISMIPAAVVFALIYFFLKEPPQFNAMKQMKAYQKAGNMEAAQAISDATG